MESEKLETFGDNDFSSLNSNSYISKNNDYEQIIPDGAILGLCNPLLDIMVDVDKDFLDKHGLIPNTKTLFDTKKTEDILHDIEQLKSNSLYVAGGSGLNTLRAATWFLQRPEVCTFIGAIGDDDTSKILRELSAKDGIKSFYQVHKEYPTGTSIVLKCNNAISLVGNLASAEYFTSNFLHEDYLWWHVENARLIYVTGFFFETSYETILKVAKYASKNNIYFCINLSSTFICEQYKNEIAQIIPYVDILFANSKEILTIGKSVFGLDEYNYNIEEEFEASQIYQEEEPFKLSLVETIAYKIGKVKQINGKINKRIVCVTQNKEPVLLFANNSFVKYGLLPVDIVDTSGAGDAFVGGFLSQYVTGNDADDCVFAGIFVSREVIQRRGCTFPNKINHTTNSSSYYYFNNRSEFIISRV